MPKRKYAGVDWNTTYLPNKISRRRDANTTVDKQPWILQLPREVLDRIAEYVDYNRYRIENCPDSRFHSEYMYYISPLRFQTHPPFLEYRNSRDSLCNMMLSCKAMLPSAGRVLYGDVVISTHKKLVSLLRSLLLSPAEWKKIRNLEISCELYYKSDSRSRDSVYSRQIRDDVNNLLQSTTSNSLPWIDSLRDSWYSCVYVYYKGAPLVIVSEECTSLLFLAVLQHAPHLRSLYLALMTEQKGELPIRISFMDELRALSTSEILCPRLEHVHLTFDNVIPTIGEKGHSVDIQVFEPLLSLGRVTKVTILNATLSVIWPSFWRSMQSISESLYHPGFLGTQNAARNQQLQRWSAKRKSSITLPLTVPQNALRRVKELTLNYTTCTREPALFWLSHLLRGIQADKLQVLRIVELKMPTGYDLLSYRHMDWERILQVIPNRSSLKRFELCKAMDYCRDHRLKCPGLQQMYRFDSLTVLRIPIPALCGDDFQFYEKKPGDLR